MADSAQSILPDGLMSAADEMAEKQDIGATPVSQETAQTAQSQQENFSKSSAAQGGRGLAKTLSKAQQVMAELASDTINVLSLGSTREGSGSTGDISGDTQQGPQSAAGPQKQPVSLSPEQKMQRDKIGFFLGIANICLTAFWMGKQPGTFFYWYTIKAVALFSTRYYIYSQKHWQYYMLEYCYFSNLLLLLEIVFAHLSGPLSWSIPAMRNSLVLHDLDKLTSLFMHMSPALVGWAVHWYPNQLRVPTETWPAAQQEEWYTGTFFQLVILPMGPYLLWSITYYLKIFVISKERVQQENYQTLFKYMTKNKKALAAKIVLRASPPFQPLLYMLMHLILCQAATATAYIWWHSYWAHTAFLVGCIGVSAWNGANYYFHVFAKRYLASVGAAAHPHQA
ncbi:hypothetical protein WJX74_000680 [Apatococcus lobatus]|uniref:Glycerophosphocholine acyltransferase 1 n=1 Tax=Apatococcus lobatus TaxID=904363 RepID=A0AAW1SFI3_9CHLO